MMLEMLAIDMMEGGSSEHRDKNSGVYKNKIIYFEYVIEMIWDTEEMNLR